MESFDFLLFFLLSFFFIPLGRVLQAKKKEVN